ncbi:MAG: PQQ-binding-like beta-propeller repeat protein [Dehalococcoidia bacterium]
MAIVLTLAGLCTSGPLRAQESVPPQAVRERFEAAWDRGDLFEAERAIEDVQGRWAQRRQADLLAEAGRAEAAQQIYEALLQVLRPGDDDDDDDEADALDDAIERLHDRPWHPGPPMLDRAGGDAAARWAWLRAEGAEFAEFSRFLSELDARRALAEAGNAHHVSLWEAVARWLADQPAGAMAPLRAEQERAVEAMLERGGGRLAMHELHDLMALYRRYPLSATLHRHMLDAAERLWREGTPDFAQAMIEDVRRYSEDAAVLARIEQALDAMPAMAPASEPQAGDQGVRWLKLPPATPWPINAYDLPAEVLARFPGPAPELVRAGRWTLAAAPGMLACYGPEGREPRWARVLPVAWPEMRGLPSTRRSDDDDDDRFDRGRYALPARFTPAVSDGLVVAPWGVSRERNHMVDLVAFDLETGRTRWTASDAPGWEGRQPLGSPIVAAGRVYTLAVRLGVLSPVTLACLDLESGELLWDTPLATIPAPSEKAVVRWEIELDHAVFGAALSLAEANVYCIVPGGLVGCVDARDGAVRWVRTYPPAAAATNHILARHGGAPLPVAGHVVFAPRDAMGAFALKADTGELTWERPFLPSERTLGRAGERVLLADGRHVVAVDANSGAIGWHRSIAEGAHVGRQGVALVLVAGEAQWQWLDATTGEVVATRDAPARELWSMLPTTDGVIATTPGPDGLAGEARGPQRWRDEPGRWELLRSNPTILTPNDGTGLDGDVLVISGGLLERRSARDATLRWHRFVDPAVRRIVWHGSDLLVLEHHQRLVGLDPATGEIRWRQALPRPIDRLAHYGEHLIVTWSGDGYWEQGIAAVSAADGTLRWAWEPDDPPTGGLHIFDVGWDGQHLYVLGRSRDRNDRDERHGQVVLRVDAADGQVMGVVELPWAGDEHAWRRVELHSDMGVLIRDRRRSDERQHPVHLLRLGTDGAWASAERLPDIWARHYWRRPHVERHGAWLHVMQSQTHGRTGRQDWLIRLDDAANAGQVYHQQRRWAVIGDIAVSLGGEPSARRLDIFDLTSGERREGAELPATDAAAPGRLRRATLMDGRLVLVTHAWRASSDEDEWHEHTGTLRIDVLDAAGKRHLGTAAVPELGLDPRDAVHMTTVGRRLLLAQRDAVVSLAPLELINHGEPALAQALPDVLHRPPEGMRIDGELAEWGEGHLLRSSVAGEVYGAAEDGRLYLAVAVPVRRAGPHRGRSHAAGGDWLEIALDGNGGWQFEDLRAWAGMGADGRADVRRLFPPRPPDDEMDNWKPTPLDPHVVVRHDRQAERLIYELSIPLWPWAHPPHRVLLSLVAWSESDEAGPQPRRRLLLGGGMAGSEVIEAGQGWFILPEAQRSARE